MAWSSHHPWYRCKDSCPQPYRWASNSHSAKSTLVKYAVFMYQRPPKQTMMVRWASPFGKMPPSCSLLLCLLTQIILLTHATRQSSQNPRRVRRFWPFLSWLHNYTTAQLVPLKQLSTWVQSSSGKRSSSLVCSWQTTRSGIAFKTKSGTK